jgi:DNA polymerase
MKKEQQLENLRNECIKCKKCNLCLGRTNLVFGVGNPESEIMLIGEAPGENEDLKGEPFVGRSGKLLDLMLGEVDLSRKKNIYISNIVKCRPPENRVPSTSEQDNCINWLYRQIDIIQPNVIICLGRTSAARIINPKIKISKEHGRFFRKNFIISSDESNKNVLIMPMLHPAAILRNLNKKPEFIADLVHMKQYLQNSNKSGDNITLLN